ncbi:hypothetical protein [Spirillospora sp. NPDC048819]|uniref:hypothetical protein n=1 Tax=Spirillospora sp. NPDC048819 TaxID=3155268 RepID=UPI0033C82AB0
MSTTGNEIKKSALFLRNKAIGRVEGEIRVLFVVLEARGLSLSDEARERIMACTDEEQLTEWATRAVTASSADELFD